MTTPTRRKFLVVGQVPPPYGGQTIMTEVLLEGRYDAANLIHVNAAFSTTLSDMGSVSWRKTTRLLRVLGTALAATALHRPTVLYYHPAGASRSAIMRDLVMLAALRPLYRRVVFHLHARGLTDACAALPAPLRWLAGRVYARPEVLLGPSTAIVEEARSLNARRSIVIPNGTRGGTPVARHGSGGRPLEILFLNLISEAKGASWLLEAFAELRSSGHDVSLRLVGEFESSSYRDAFAARARQLGVTGEVRLSGTLVGDEKWHALASADIFCLPTTWPQESFGLALIEAASCGLPVVAADVPGVREVLEPGVSILLADPADRDSLRAHLELLCRDADARVRLGTQARAAFEERYTVAHYWAALDEVFAMIDKEPRVAS